MIGVEEEAPPQDGGGERQQNRGEAERDPGRGRAVERVPEQRQVNAPEREPEGGGRGERLEREPDTAAPPPGAPVTSRPNGARRTPRGSSPIRSTKLLRVPLALVDLGRSDSRPSFSQRFFKGAPIAARMARVERNMGVGAGRASDPPSTGLTARKPYWA